MIEDGGRKECNDGIRRKEGRIVMMEESGRKEGKQLWGQAEGRKICIDGRRRRERRNFIMEEGGRKEGMFCRKMAEVMKTVLYEILP